MQHNVTRLRVSIFYTLLLNYCTVRVATDPRKSLNFKIAIFPAC